MFRPIHHRTDKDETEDEVPIIAPGDGYIIEKNVTPGRTVEFVCSDFRHWRSREGLDACFGASGRSGEASRQDSPHSVSLAGNQRSAYRGKIVNLGQEFDPDTRMMQVRIELDNASGRLRPEMLADAEIPFGGGRRRCWWFPSDAIQQVNGQDVVFVRTAPDRFSVRPVRVGETADGQDSDP